MPNTPRTRKQSRPIAHTVMMAGMDTKVASMTSLSDGTFLMTRSGRSTRRTRKTFSTPPVLPPEIRSKSRVTMDIVTMNPSRQFQ